MAIKDYTRVGGYPIVQLFGPDGREKERRDCSNLIVNTGMELIAAKFVQGPASSQAVPEYMAVGEGQTAPTVEDTSLEFELLPRKPYTDSFIENNPKPVSAVLVSLFDKGEASGAITEAGLFTTQTGGVMTNRVTFPVVNKQPDDILQLTWRLTFTSESESNNGTPA